MSALDPATRTGAVISADGRYRYSLMRVWDEGAAPLVFVMLNPSTADASEDDPTIRRCVAFAKRQGFGGILVVNLFAFRSTDPKVMARAVDPVGPDNDEAIEQAVSGRTVLVAWGANATRERAKAVTHLLSSLDCAVYSLGVTKGGHPRHPLYIRGDQPFEPWEAAA